jgi:hypothetical protein
MALSADPYAQWRKYLAGEGLRDYVRGLHAGFYRVRFGVKNEWTPLAIFEHEGELGGLLLGEWFSEEELDGFGLWPRAARMPITEVQYRAMAENGRTWKEVKECKD